MTTEAPPVAYLTADRQPVTVGGIYWNGGHLVKVLEVAARLEERTVCTVELHRCEFLASGVTTLIDGAALNAITRDGHAGLAAARLRCVNCGSDRHGDATGQCPACRQPVCADCGPALRQAGITECIHRESR